MYVLANVFLLLPTIGKSEFHSLLQSIPPSNQAKWLAHYFAVHCRYFLDIARTVAMTNPNSTPRQLEGTGKVKTDRYHRTFLEIEANAAPRTSNSKDSTPDIQVKPKLAKQHNSHYEGGDMNQYRPPHSYGLLEPHSPAERVLEENPVIAMILGCPTATRHFWHATLTPPITKTSLSELDISSIINNSKLRHDVNFDRELHFRPNLEGRKGLTKRDAQHGYWQAITAELQLYPQVCGQFRSESDASTLWKDCQRRIPLMFNTIKEILKHLVPDRDQRSVDEHLDVPMIMQEIENGVCDFVSIAVWLAQLLKRHCAPMRDEMVNRMVEKIRKGEANLDAESISAGLHELFAVLEAMKLVGYDSTICSSHY